VNNQILPPPEGPEYTPCVCSHIEPEHDINRRRCTIDDCGCNLYRPVVSAGQAPATDQTALRDRIAEALRACGIYDEEERIWRSLSPAWIEEIVPAVLAVLPAPVDRATETEQLREKYRAGLRRADQINNELMEEVQRYAEGEERPVLWSVYNAMHKRALEAEQERDRVLAELPTTTTLTPDQRSMLTYALDQAQERIWAEDGFTDEDQAAVTSLRRLTVECPQCDGTGACNGGPCPLRRMADEAQPAQAPVHLGGRANAEDCPACTAEKANLPYPFLCPAETGAKAQLERSPYLSRIRQALANADDAADRFAANGMDPERFRLIIEGQQRPTSLDLALIADACRVTVGWLTANHTDEDSPTGSSDD
jgi:hypothetical protein